MLRHYREGLWKGKWHPWWIFFPEENQSASPVSWRALESGPRSRFPIQSLSEGKTGTEPRRPSDWPCQ